MKGVEASQLSLGDVSLPQDTNNPDSPSEHTSSYWGHQFIKRSWRRRAL